MNSEMKRYQEEADKKDREILDALSSGGVPTLLALIGMFDADRKGFEDQIFQGRESALDPKLDELIALRAYADRMSDRMKYFLSAYESRTGIPAKAAPEKK